MNLNGKPHGDAMVGPLDANAPTVLTSAPNAIALVKALRRRWRMALFVATACGLAAALTCWFIMPPAKHTARTHVRVPQGSPFLFRTNEPTTSLQDHQRNQVAMAKSRLVLNSALKDRRTTDLSILRDKSDPILWLEREIQVDFNVAPEVMRISIDGDEPGELVVLVNALRDAYFREILDKERVDRNERLAMVRQTREKYEGQLKARKEEQRKFEQMAGAGRDAGARGLSLAFTQQQLNWFERELIQTQSELRRTRAELSGLKELEKTLGSAPVPEAMLEDNFAKDPLIQQHKAHIQALHLHLNETAKNARGAEQSPAAVAIRKRIDDAEKTLVGVRKQMEPMLLEELKQRRRFEASRSLQSAEMRVAVLAQDEKVLESEVGNLRKSLKDRTENVNKADAEKEDMSQLEAMTNKIVEEEEKLKVELIAPPRHAVLEEGVVTKPLESKRVMLLSGGLGAGTFATILLAFALTEFRLRRVYTPDEVVFGLGLPLVGAIPDTNSKAARESQSDAEQSFLDEAVDTLRTMLLRTAQQQSLRVVLVTSAQSGEGKTSLSTHLAASLAQVGYSTLLIDGDLRNPIAHQVFNLSRGPGLCDLLRDEATLDEVIRETGVTHLSMITAGKWDGGATRALAREGARQLIEGLRTRFDFVIIDSSPVLPVVDPLLLGQHADGAIISVLREVSRMPNVYAAYQRLTDGGVRVLGAVMSGVRGERYGAYYPYSYTAAPADQPAA
jgi:capsular exopolysaccharide synthesis family protein